MKRQRALLPVRMLNRTCDHIVLTLGVYMWRDLDPVEFWKNHPQSMIPHLIIKRNPVLHTRHTVPGVYLRLDSARYEDVASPLAICGGSRREFPVCGADLRDTHCISLYRGYFAQIHAELS